MHSLIPPQDQWPVFDSISIYTPSSSDLAAMPIPPSRTSPRNKNPNHIPRPRNAFMLFRSAFAAAQKITSTIEHDNRHITRIIAHCWNRLSEPEKQVWRDKAAAEKEQHAQLYPGYRFSPAGRTSRRVKRNVRRNGIEDVKRCEKLAELVMAGKLGQELENAIKQIDDERLAAAHVVDDRPDGSTVTETQGSLVDNTKGAVPSDIPPFLSPLLPPAQILSQQIPKTPELLACDTPAQHIEPLTIGSDSDLEYLLGPPCYSFYQPDTHNSVTFPRSLDHYQSVMNFVQSSYAELEQSTSEYPLFSCNLSDDFSYYS